MVNPFESNTTSLLFEKRGNSVNPNQDSAANDMNTATSANVNNNNDVIMDEYDTLTLEEWMNHGELFADFNAGRIIPTPGRVSNKDLAAITLLCCETKQR